VFVLVEPCISDYLVDRPDLGCAMILAACKARGIKANLIKGQTRYLRDMFINDSEELWNLMQRLSPADLKQIKISQFGKIIQEKGKKQFQAELKDLYDKIIVNQSARIYFNADLIEKLDHLRGVFLKTYLYYVNQKKFINLSIIERYFEEILRYKPRYVGFSLKDQFDPFSRVLRKKIKEFTDVPIIVGGSLTPFIDLKNLNKLFAKEYFDYLVVGPGECALPSLIESLEEKNEPEGIANVFYQKDGKIRAGDLKIIEDLDRLPYPDFSQFDLDLYLTPERILPLQTARGCSWARCSFCSHHSIYLKQYRTFNIGKVVDTIKHLQITYNCSHFVFNDEELPPGRAKIISKAILKSRIKNIYLATYARLVEGYNNDNLLRLMRQAGFVQFLWGMESGCQRILDLMNKGTKVSTAGQILKKCWQRSISSICWIIFGFPGETKEETQETVDFLRKNSRYIEFLMLGAFRISRHSPISENPEKWGVKIKKQGSYAVSGGMTQKESKLFVRQFCKKLAANIIRCTSGKLNYFLPSFLARMLHFLKSSHQLLDSQEVLSRIKKRKLNSVYPLILGEIIKTNQQLKFMPVKSDETIFINEIVNKNAQFFKRQERILDRREKKIFVLSKGNLSIGQIVFKLQEDCKSRQEKEFIKTRCLDFYSEIFSQNWGLGFARGWTTV